MISQITKMVSFDTSSTVTGWAYFENGVLVDSGVLDHSKEKDSSVRIEDMCLEIVDVLGRYRPEIVTCEEQAFAKSVSVAVINAKILGVIQGWCLTTGYAEFVTIRPSVWRKLVAEGQPVPKDRKEVKPWDVKRAMEITGLDITDDNEADAILIGIARIEQFKEAV